MGKIRQQEELGAHRIVQQEFIKHFQPKYKQGNRNRLLKHLKPVIIIFHPKIEDESAAARFFSVDYTGPDLTIPDLISWKPVSAHASTSILIFTSTGKFNM